MKNILATLPFGELERVIIKIKAPGFDETWNQTNRKKKGAGRMHIDEYFLSDDDKLL